MQSDGKNILLDAGLGTADPCFVGSSENDIHKQLQKVANITVDDIDYVILSHLHRDHTGWVMKKDENGQLVP